jgi:hypothetical protein
MAKGTPATISIPVAQPKRIVPQLTENEYPKAFEPMFS